MYYHIITIFPSMCDSYLTQSILGAAIDNKIIEVTAYDLRSYTLDKHRRVDGRVYGGGPGMVMWVQPIISCHEDIIKRLKARNKRQGKEFNAQRILTVIFEPGATDFDNDIAERVGRDYDDIIFICGRYEGIDARVYDILLDNESISGQVVKWSVGPYILTGGELPSMICVDAISRRLPGVLHNEYSLEENRVSSHAMYGRPEKYIHSGPTPDFAKATPGKPALSEGEGITREYKVPEVLLSGHHANIEKWKEGR